MPGARLFGSSGDKIEFASNAAINDYEDSTQVFWVYMPNTATDFRIATWKGITADESTASLSVQITNGHKIAAFFSDGGTYDNVASSDNVTTNSYIYLVVRQRKTPAEDIEILVGSKDDEAEVVALGTDDISGGSPVANSGQPFVLGNGDGSAEGLNFQGRISLFSYWNRWLTDEEIEDLRSRDRPPDDDLPGIWVDLGEIVGDQVTNFGTGPDGTLTGTTEAVGAELPPRPSEESATVNPAFWRWRN